MSAESEFETWFPRGDRVGPAGVPVRYRARRGGGADMNPFQGRTKDERFKDWLAARSAARDARRGPFESWFPLGDITMDHSFARHGRVLGRVRARGNSRACAVKEGAGASSDLQRPDGHHGE